jgi:trimeric autotransporter adhesin
MRALPVGFKIWLLAVVSLQALGAPTESAAPAVLADLPATAQSSISAVVGRDLPQYYPRPSNIGLEAVNAQQKLVTHFRSGSLEVWDGNAHWDIALSAYGRGSALQAMTPAAPHADRNRVEYRHGSLTEWYINGPAGLEQGFTISRSPGGSAGKPLTIALAISGDFAAVIDQHNTGLTLSNSQKGVTLQYAGLIAHDASGRDLDAWVELHGTELLLKVSDGGARYPVVIDPTIKQAKLLASDGQDGDHFGYSIAISGNTLVVGSPFADVGSNSAQGAAYVFVKPATGGWVNATQNAKLISSDGMASDNFGFSVAIKGDQIAVGAPGRSTNAGVVGEAYFFEKPLGGWVGTITEAVNLGSGHTSNAQYGMSVGVQNFVVIVGAPGDNAAYLLICAKSQPTCGLDATFFGPDQGQGNNAFGTAVAISGKSFVVTDPLFTGAQAEFQGAAFVYTNVQGTNNFSKATLTASDGALLSELGISVSIDGNTVAVGAPFSTVGNQPAQGAVYVYTKPPSGWADATQTGKLTASDGVSQDELGMSVSVSGPVIIAGAPRRLVGFNSEQGAAYVFMKGSVWLNQTENFEITASDGLAFTGFGQSVGISGFTAVAGCPFGNTPHDLPGSAYVLSQ